MKKLRLRALVLAAGRGERLRPLTDSIPKPLLPIAGLPVAAHTLERLRRAGCEEVALNLHYLGEQIHDRFGDSFEGMPLRYSPETTLQGTLGALHPLRDFLRDADAVLLVNGDSYCRWPLEALVRRHLRSDAAATLLLVRRAPADELRRGVAVDGHGRVVGFRGRAPSAGPDADPLQRRVFGGAHVLSPALLEAVPEGPGDIVAGLYQPLLDRGGRISSLLTGRRWHDLGKARRYLDAALDAGLGWGLGRSRVGGGAVVEPDARLRHSVVESGARVGSRARLERCLVLPGGTVGAGCRLSETIVGFGAALPPGTAVERRLITPRGSAPPSPDDTVVGSLVFTPIDG